jgi:RNA polymerase sigma-70 factor (ECF subfamily)
MDRLDRTALTVPALQPGRAAPLPGVTRPAPVLDDAAQLRAARTDPDAFAAFYVRWAPALHAWLRTRLPADAANELTAETFAQALVSLGRFRGVRPGSGVAWLWGIARNLVRQHHRHARLERSARERLGIAERGYDSGGWDEAEARAGAAALAAELARALDGLSREQRRAVELRIVADLDFGAVAEHLDCREPAARMRVSRALAGLRSRLGATS